MISRDGRFIAFTSLNHKFVSDDMNGERDIIDASITHQANEPNVVFG